ncbi:hypothetical protein VPH35_124539 [Triticum aestivum]
MPPYGDMPLAATPPCLVHCPRRFAFAHLRTPDPNPTPLISRAIQLTCGNPTFIMGGSWRWVACLTFHTPSARNDVVRRSPIDFEGNSIIIEPVEHVDRSIAIFTDLAEIEVSEFPHELWHNNGIRFALAFLGDVCAVDDFCLHGIDYTSILALVMLQSGKPAPPGIIIQLPPINEIKIAKVVEISRWHHGDGANPFGGDSSDGDSAPLSRHASPRPASPEHLTPIISAIRAGWHADPTYGGTRPVAVSGAAPAAPDPSGHATIASALPLPLPPPGSVHQPLVISGDDSAGSEDMHAPLLHADLPRSMDVVHAPVGGSSGPLVIRPSPLVGAVDPPPPPSIHADATPPARLLTPSDTSAFTAVVSEASNMATVPNFTFSAGESSRSAALPVHDLDTHECTIRKERRKTARAQSCSKEKLHRSARLAGKEARYSPMLAKAVKAKAARLSAADVGTAIDRAIHEARLDVSDGPPASAEDLTAIALLCGADDG